MTRFYHCAKIEMLRMFKFSFQCFPSKIKNVPSPAVVSFQVFTQVSMDLLLNHSVTAVTGPVRLQTLSLPTLTPQSVTL